MISVTYLWTSILACIRRFKPGSMLINSAAFGGRKATLGRMGEKRTIAWLVADLNFEVASTRYRAVYPAAGLNKNGWKVERPNASMFVWAQMPEEMRPLGSLEFAKRLVQEAKVAVSPGIGFGDAGEGFVRFALIENEERIRQAVRGIRNVLQNTQRT